MRHEDGNFNLKASDFVSERAYGPWPNRKIAIEEDAAETFVAMLEILEEGGPDLFQTLLQLPEDTIRRRLDSIGEVSPLIREKLLAIILLHQVDDEIERRGAVRNSIS